MDRTLILKHINYPIPETLSAFERTVKAFEFHMFLDETAVENARGFKIMFGDKFDKECHIAQATIDNHISSTPKR